MVFSNNLLLGVGGQSTDSSFNTTLIGNSVWLDGSADFLSAELGAKTRMCNGRLDTTTKI